VTAVGTPTQIAQLLRETGTAHHRAFAPTNGDDPDGPEYCAAWLLERHPGTDGGTGAS